MEDNINDIEALDSLSSGALVRSAPQRGIARLFCGIAAFVASFLGSASNGRGAAR